MRGIHLVIVAFLPVATREYIWCVYEVLRRANCKLSFARLLVGCDCPVVNYGCAWRRPEYCWMRRMRPEIQRFIFRGCILGVKATVKPTERR